MAHFAQLDSNNVVLQVIVIHNNDCQLNGAEDENTGIAFCKSLYGVETNWAQTSYNGNMRKNYAGIGYTLDRVRQAFIAPQPFASWILNETTCSWEPPTAMPADGKQYQWDESSTSWVETV